MVSLRQRILVRRAWTRLVTFGVLSITSLLVITNSSNRTAAWPSPVRQALAQSDTATPTAVPQASATPKPTAGLGEPPLTLQSSASVGSVIAGEQFSFTTTIAASSAEPRTVELRTNIDSQLELLSVNGGSCRGGTALSCKLSVQRGRPVTIEAAVRVLPNAAAGSRLVYQALAQDDLSNTAASDQVIVTIAAPPAASTTAPTTAPTRPPDPAPSPTPNQSIPANGGQAPARPTIAAGQTSRPAPTAAPAGAANPVAQSTPAPTALALPVMPTTSALPSSGEATGNPPVIGAAPADSWLESAPGVPTPAQALAPAAPAPIAPEQAIAAPAAVSPAVVAAAVPAAVEQRQIVQLPNTTGAPPIAGLVGILLGLALTIHSLRRVCRAAAQLDRQSAALGRLVTLASAQARRRARIDGRPPDSREE